MLKINTVENILINFVWMIVNKHNNKIFSKIKGIKNNEYSSY